MTIISPMAAQLLYAAMLLFLLAMLTGVVLVRDWLAGAPIARQPLFLHRGLAGIALLFLIEFALRQSGWVSVLALLLLAACVLVGFYLYYMGMPRTRGSWRAVVAHVVLAAAGVVVLLGFYFG